MSELKLCFESMNFKNVMTYIQSGNVLFSADMKNIDKLTKEIEINLSEKFNYKASIVIITHSQLIKVLENAPSEFGKDADNFRYDVIFLKPPLTAPEVMQKISTKEGVDRAYSGENVLYFSRLISKAAQSHLTNLIKLPVYKEMTIRNWKTTTKLFDLGFI